jgi:hypothetical protein
MARSKQGSLKVHEVVIFDGLGKRTAVDLHSLELDDGSRAFDLLAQPAILYRKLRAMKVPEIAVDMGSHQLFLCLARYRAATKIDQVTGKPAVEGNAA